MIKLYRKVVFFFTFLLLTYSSSFSQISKIDSLKTLVGSSPDSTQLNLFLQIAKAYTGKNTDSLAIYADRAYLLAKKLDNQKAISSALNIKGNASFFQANYKTAVEWYNEALVIATATNDSIQMGALLNNMGSCTMYQAKYDEAIKYLLQAKAIRTTLHDPKITSTINNLGNVYYRLKDYDMALPFYLEAAELKEKYNQRKSLANTLNNIGIILKNQGKPSEAIPYYLKSLAIAEEFEDLNKQGYAHNNLAILYKTIEELELAEKHYIQAIAAKQKINDKTALLNSYKSYGLLLITKGELAKAKQLIDRADSINNTIGKNTFSSEVFLSYSVYYEAIGDYKQALSFTNKALNMRIDEINQDRNDKIAEMEVRYETVQRAADLEQADLKNKLQEQQLAEANFQLIAILLISTITVAFIIVFYYLRSKRAIAEKEVQELQVDALKKRLFELQLKHEGQEKIIDIIEINKDLKSALTEREVETLQLSLEGLHNSEIAEKLFVSINTVKFHLRNIYLKLGVKGKKEVLSYVAKTT